jgi:hypothetical protein
MKRTALAALALALLAITAAASGVAASRGAARFALAIEPVPGPTINIAAARRTTAAGVMAGLVAPGMAVEVTEVAVGSTGHTVLYGHVPTVPPPASLPPAPRKPGPDATGTQTRIYKAELAAWQATTARIRQAYEKDKKKAANTWARNHVAAILNTNDMAHTPITPADVAVALLRAETLFQHELHNSGTPLLVFIGDLPKHVPQLGGFNLQLNGAHIVLAGWTISAPQTYKPKVTRWVTWLLSLGAADVKVLTPPLDNTRNIVAALETAIGTP